MQWAQIRNYVLTCSDDGLNSRRLGHTFQARGEVLALWGFDSLHLVSEAKRSVMGPSRPPKTRSLLMCWQGICGNLSGPHLETHTSNSRLHIHTKLWVRVQEPCRPKAKRVLAEPGRPRLETKRGETDAEAMGKAGKRKAESKGGGLFDAPRLQGFRFQGAGRFGGLRKL